MARAPRWCGTIHLEFARFGGQIWSQTVPVIGYNVALEAARNFRRLQRLGVTIRAGMEMLIGTFCIVNGISLLHNDRDIDAMERHLGLVVA
jgi:predicted nucleic acid-binding protein